MDKFAITILCSASTGTLMHNKNYGRTKATGNCEPPVRHLNLPKYNSAPSSVHILEK